MHASKGHWGQSGHAVNDDLTCWFFMTNATTFLILINGIFFVSDYTTGISVSAYKIKRNIASIKEEVSTFL